MADEQSDLEPEDSRRAHVVGLLVMLAILALCATVRINGALNDPGFDSVHPEGMLKSETGLIHYTVERIVEAGGLPPDDFRADARIQHPEPADMPAMFTVCQEYLVAWCYLLFGGGMALHTFAVWVMGIFASFSIVGVYGLSWELGRKVRWAVYAAALYAALPFSYRTVGLIYEREEFSLPCFAIHLWLVARAVRVGTWKSFVFAALALVLALASWHMMAFIVTLEALAVFLWFVRGGRNAFEVPRLWILPAVAALASLAVPVLRSKLFLFSLPMQMCVALLVVALVGRRLDWKRGRQVLVGVGTLAITVPLGMGLTRWIAGGGSDYSHVFEFFWAKLTHLGTLPENAETLPFGARLLWQGPFSTSTLDDLSIGLGAGLLFLALGIALAVPGWTWRKGETAPSLLGAAAAGTLVVAWLVRRVLILPSLLAPILAVTLLRRSRWPAVLEVVLVVAILAQGEYFFSRVGSQVQTWYQPQERREEIRRLVRWIEQELPEDEAILGDYVVATSILAHSRNPMLLQPKYETAESRRRIEEFYTTFLQGTVRDVGDLCRKYDTRYLLVDRYVLWPYRWVGGVPQAQEIPAQGTAAWAFMQVDRKALERVRGFQLRYCSPPQRERDQFRLYELVGRR